MNQTENKTPNKKETGTSSDERFDPFAKKSVIRRSPQRTYSFSEGTKDPRPKRPREDSPPEEKRQHQPKEGHIIKSLISQMQNEINKMKATIQVNINTKKEIKDGIIKLDGIANQLKGSKIQMFLEDTQDTEAHIQMEKENSIRSAKIDVFTSTTRPTKTMVDAETQTYTPQEKEANEVRDGLREATDVTDLKAIMDRSWPECTFRNVEIDVGNPLSKGTEGDLAIYVEDPEMNTGIGRIFKERYPELAQIKQPIKENITYLTSVVKVPSTDSEWIVKERVVFKIWPRKKDKDSDKTEEMCHNLKKLRSELEKLGRTRILLPIPEDYETDKFRKLLEYAFMESSAKVTLHVPKNRTLEPNKESLTGQHRKRLALTNKFSRDTEAVIVKKGDMTYASLLKELKKQVDPKKLNLDVRNVRKTKEGDMLLTIKGDKEKAEQLRSAIGDTIQNVETRYAGRRGILFHLYDIDEITTKDEIKEAIQAQTGCSQGIEIKSLRPNSVGGQVATVSLDPEIAEKIRITGRIRIGWCHCKARERVTIPKCFNCLQHGHQSKTCKGPNRDTFCYNCGEEGHKAIDCKKEQFCWNCEKKGHKTGSSQCIVFREMLKKARKLPMPV